MYVIAGSLSTQLSPVESGKSQLLDTLPKSGPVELPVTAHGLQCWQDIANTGKKLATDVVSALLVRYSLAGMHKPPQRLHASPDLVGQLARQES